MELMDRRRFLRKVLDGAAVATVATTAGLTLIPNVAKAAPLAMDKSLPKIMEDFVEKTQTVVVHRGRRRRRWRCWWRRGRRVCGWRYW